MEYGKYVRNISDDFYTVFERLMSAMEKVTFEEGELEEF